MITTDVGNARKVRLSGVGMPVPDEGRAPLPFGANAQSVRYRRIDLTTARTRARISIGAANCIAIFGSTGPVAYALASFGERDEDKIPLREGLILRGVSFRELYLTHIAQPDQFLGVLTLVDPGASFDLQVPSPITPLMAHRSGLGFSNIINTGANVAEYGATVLVNALGSDWVAYLHDANSSSGGGRLGIVAITNAAITGAGNMAVTAGISTHGNYIRGVSGNQRANQVPLYNGTHTTVIGLADRMAMVSTFNTEPAGTVHGDIYPVLPGFHMGMHEGAANNAVNHWLSWFELPLELVKHGY